MNFSRAANKSLMLTILDFTKPHGQCIIDTICDQCNGAYQAHVEENPEFQGHVHMIGFSLGGVACYDILSMQWSLEEDGTPPWENVKPDPYICAKPDVNIPKLAFKVQNLFTCGSPIGEFVVMGCKTSSSRWLTFYQSCLAHIPWSRLYAFSSTSTHPCLQHLPSF